MKKIILVCMGILCLHHTLTAQTMRYFEFTTACGHGAWQDTSFIAATSDPIMIDTMLANLAKPMAERHFISGYIAHGNDGYNHNADHWFLWHFIPGQWWLAQNAIEVCDGCPYSDVDADPFYWVDHMGIFCPWTALPSREISAPLGIEDPGLENEVLVYPNPATNYVHISTKNMDKISVVITDALGQEIQCIRLQGEHKNIDITTLTAGIYFLEIISGNRAFTKKLVVKR